MPKLDPREAGLHHGFNQLGDRRTGELVAARSLEVAVLDNHHRRVGIADRAALDRHACAVLGESGDDRFDHRLVQRDRVGRVVFDIARRFGFRLLLLSLLRSLSLGGLLGRRLLLGWRLGLDLLRLLLSLLLRSDHRRLPLCALGDLGTAGRQRLVAPAGDRDQCERRDKPDQNDV